jgi:hypothetical protein
MLASAYPAYITMNFPSSSVLKQCLFILQAKVSELEDELENERALRAKVGFLTRYSIVLLRQTIRYRSHKMAVLCFIFM